MKLLFVIVLLGAVAYFAPAPVQHVEQTIEIETDLAVGGKTSCLARGTIQGEAAEEKPDVASKPKP